MPDWDILSVLKDMRSSIDKLPTSSKNFNIDSLDELRKKDPDRADGLLATHIGGLSEGRQNKILKAARTLRSDRTQMIKGNWQNENRDVDRKMEAFKREVEKEREKRLREEMKLHLMRGHGRVGRNRQGHFPSDYWGRW